MNNSVSGNLSPHWRRIGNSVSLSPANVSSTILFFLVATCICIACSTRSFSRSCHFSILLNKNCSCDKFLCSFPRSDVHSFDLSKPLPFCGIHLHICYMAAIILTCCSQLVKEQIHPCFMLFSMVAASPRGKACWQEEKSCIVSGEGMPGS